MGIVYVDMGYVVRQGPLERRQLTDPKGIKEKELDMPICFSLTRKGDTKPLRLTDVDNDIRIHFGAKQEWYDWIGYLMATGKELGSEELREAVGQRDNDQEILAYLEANYISNAWHELKEVASWKR